MHFKVTLQVCSKEVVCINTPKKHPHRMYFPLTLYLVSNKLSELKRQVQHVKRSAECAFLLWLAPFTIRSGASFDVILTASVGIFSYQHSACLLLATQQLHRMDSKMNVMKFLNGELFIPVYYSTF